MRLEGVHHVTCITGDVRQNVDFYTRVMGLRLVAKSVNQDDPYIYHLFFADEEGDPGSDLTFFEYRHAVRGRAGAGMVHRILWRVPSTGALTFWESRLADEGLTSELREDELIFADPEGLEHSLRIDRSGDAPLIADHPEIPRELALAGFDGVRAFARRPEASGDLLERVMGAERKGDWSWELRGQKRGATFSFDPAPEAPGRSGAGTVHHVAWHTTVAEHPLWLERLREMGVRSTPIVDRYYFHSIYFHEPNGVLFEIADDGPGFARDGSVEELGRKVILPPWLERRRAEIEAHLTPIADPRASWAAPKG